MIFSRTLASAMLVAFGAAETPVARPTAGVAVPTPNDATVVPLFCDGIATYCGSPLPGLPFAAGSQTVPSLVAS